MPFSAGRSAMLFVACLMTASATPEVILAQSGNDLVLVAEEYFRSIYGCRPDRVSDLAAEDIVITYPIFEEILGKVRIEGRSAAVDFAEGFCQRWADPEFSIDETVVEGRSVVLMWSFSGTHIAAESDSSGVHPRRSWGGITLFKFSEDGLIEAEIGEESTPGPAARVSTR